MWKLAIEDDQANQTVVNLVRDEYTLGRDESNTVRLTERNISRQHARLARNGQAWVLTDNNSYNGCFVNGERVTDSRELNDGDLVQVGDYRLQVMDAVTDSASHDLSATVPASPKSQSLVSQVDRLVLLVGPTPGAQYPLSGNARFVLGRGEECDIAINHSSVSRVHADIQVLDSGHYEIVDRGSANGIRINGVELQRSLVDAYDAIELGDVVLKFIPRGEIYVPQPGDTQRLVTPSNTPEGLNPVVSVAHRAQALGQALPGSLRIASGLIVLGLLAVLGMVTLGSGEPGSETVPASGNQAVSADRAAATLQRATSLLKQGKVQAAHRKANELPAEGELRKTPEFREIEARWADRMFERASKESDPSLKRELLDTIAKSPSVDSVRRKRAANEVAALDAEGVDVDELPNAPQASPPPSEPDGSTTMAATATRPQSGMPSRKQRARPSSTSSTSEGIVRDNPFDESPSDERDTREMATSGDRSQAEAAKKALKAKAANGQATAEDKRLLRALCRQLDDATCAN